MSTAAHVLDERAGAGVYVGGASRSHLVPILGGLIRTTTAPDGNRNRDHFDCGFWDMPQDAVTALGEVDFIDPARISPNSEPTEHRYYKATGYRYSRNKSMIDRRRMNITPARSGYAGTVSDNPELSEALGVSGAEHLFVNFDPDNITDEAGKTANIFSPVGFSGGALVDLGDFTDPASYSGASNWRPALSGMLIEHQAKYKAMVAVRIEWIVAGIRKALRT